jgi:predicted alpha/beta superfamily hydrolase
MLYKLNLIPLLIIPVLTSVYLVRERIIEVPGFGPEKTAETLPPAEHFEIASVHTGATYQVSVQLPHEYDPNGEGYPVFYTLQADPTAESFDEIIAPLLQRGRIPDIIYVSITRQLPRQNLFMALERGGRAQRDSHSWADDLTFYADPADPAEGGGAEKFLQFLREELFQMIDTKYNSLRTDRGIGGRDLGGSFAVEVSYRHPGLFKRAIAISPRVHFADYAMIDGLRALELRQRRRTLTRLYVGSGADNYPMVVHGFELLQGVLDQLNTRTVDVQSELLRGRGGDNEVVPAAQAGLRFAYDED